MKYEKAKKIVFSALEKNVPNLTMSDERIGETLEELGVDSLDVMLVLMDISEAADIEINDDQAEELNSAKKIIDLLEKLSN